MAKPVTLSLRRSQQRLFQLILILQIWLSPCSELFALSQKITIAFSNHWEQSQFCSTRFYLSIPYMECVVTEFWIIFDLFFSKFTINKKLLLFSQIAYDLHTDFSKMVKINVRISLDVIFFYSCVINVQVWRFLTLDLFAFRVLVVRSGRLSNIHNLLGE